MRNLEKLIGLGIDVDTGIACCAGDEEFYWEMLDEYALESIGNIKTMQTALASADWNAYRICVHSIKSTSGMIGAYELSEKARELETAAAKGNTDAIAAAHESFLAEYKTVVEATRY